MILRLTHITFQVLDFEQSIEFYKKWFALEIHKDRRPYTIWMTTKEQNQKETPDFVFVLEKETVGKINHFGFQVSERIELDLIADQARKENILIEGPIDVGGVVGSYVLIRDPNAHVWEYTWGQPIAGI